MTHRIDLLIAATKFQSQLFGLLDNLCLSNKAFTGKFGWCFYKTINNTMKIRSSPALLFIPEETKVIKSHENAIDYNL